jgi:crotonobetainyl-CoA:carnitine CoA-transferase CaiB-like acyl-CoA transferase
VRVVAIEQAVAAPLCTRHLADLGADVIKIERPGSGDFARQYDDVVNGLSAYFVWLNRGKRSIALDLKKASDIAVLWALLDRSDVFIHNLGPGAMERLGLEAAVVQARWPQLINCSISGYGQDGPYRDRKAFDLLLQGESGLLAVTGTPDEPAKVGISIGDVSAGMYALSAILAALYQRVHTSRGERIEISMLECLTEWMMAPIYYQLYRGAPPPRAGMRHNMIVPYGPYRVAEDKWVNLAVQNDGQWRRFCARVLEQPALADDPRYSTNERRAQHRVELETLIEEMLSQHTAEEVQRRLAEADVPFGALNRVADILEHPQLEARQRWFTVESPGGPVRATIPPFNLSSMYPRPEGIPELGEHTEQILKELENHAQEPNPGHSNRTP